MTAKSHEIWALFLDVDGTLLDIEEGPEKVRVPAGLADTLQGLWRDLNGALALVSGRPIATLDRLFFPLHLPSAGQQGSELRLSADGEIKGLPVAPTRARIRREIASMAAGFPGVEVEDKGLSIAIHYRRRPDIDDRLEGQLEKIVAADGGCFVIARGKMVLELHDSRYSKATAVHAFMGHPTFEKRVPIFVGDDTVDEAGFRAAEHYSGVAMAVGEVHHPKRRTAFGEPAEVRLWLAGLIDRLSRGQPPCPI
jgi:trehalose 6-phosphate phosphatase